jgi:hypothetical protein
MTDDDDEMNTLIRRVLRPKERDPYEAAQEAMRDSYQALEETRARHPPTSPELAAAEAHFDVAVAGWRQTKDAAASAETTSFDGGARETPPEGPPSMDSLLRAGHEAAKDRIVSRARDIDH